MENERRSRMFREGSLELSVTKSIAKKGLGSFVVYNSMIFNPAHLPDALMTSYKSFYTAKDDDWDKVREITRRLQALPDTTQMQCISGQPNEALEHAVTIMSGEFFAEPNS